MPRDDVVLTTGQRVPFTYDCLLLAFTGSFFLSSSHLSSACNASNMESCSRRPHPGRAIPLRLLTPGHPSTQGERPRLQTRGAGREAACGTLSGLSSPLADLTSIYGDVVAGSQCEDLGSLLRVHPMFWSWLAGVLLPSQACSLSFTGTCLLLALAALLDKRFP